MEVMVEVDNYQEMIDKLYALSKDEKLRQRFKAICDPKTGYSLVSKSRVRRLDSGEIVAARKFCEIHGGSLHDVKQDSNISEPTKPKKVLSPPKRTLEPQQYSPNPPASAQPQPEPQAEPGEEEFQRLISELSKAPDEANLIDVSFPSLGARDYLDHQRIGIRWLLTPKPNGMVGGILADEPGLGKTVQALIAAKLLGLPVLVATPASTVENWSREAEMAGMDMENIHICSWEGLKNWTEEIKRNGKGTKTFKAKGFITEEDFVFIGDESHYLQTITSVRCQKTLAVINSGHCKGVFLLTGTPMPNALPKNIFPLLLMVEHPLTLDQRNFEIRYCNGKLKSMMVKGREVRFWDIDGAKNLDEMARLIAPYILLRYKRECVQLPPKTKIVQWCELEQEDKDTYEAELKAMREKYLDRVEREEIMANAAVQLGQLRQAASFAKVNYAVKMALDLVSKGNQVIVFTWFKETAVRLAEKLGCEMISGAVLKHKRQPIVDRFEAGENKCIVCTLGAGGTGINLIAGNWILQVERPFVPGIEEQASNRSDRVGQTRPVTNVWLQAFEVDQYVDAMVERKSSIIDLVIRGKRKTLRGMGATPGSIAKALLPAILERD